MFSAYFQEIKDFFAGIFKSRILVLKIVLCVFSGILFLRLFDLQIIHGQDYLDNFTLTIEKERTIQGARGNIYDCNGVLLAYNELAYVVTIEDIGTYDTLEEKNTELNNVINKVLMILKKHGDSIDNNFYIEIKNDGTLDYSVTGITKLRFLADVFGYAKVDSLKYNRDLGCNEADVTAKQLVDYLCAEERYGIDAESYPDINTRLEILAVRYGVAQNSYQKYVTTTIAQQISNESYAEIMENLNTLPGINISENAIRKYNYSEYLAPIIGYTGKISTTEMDEYKSNGDNYYSINDMIGKSGIEQLFETKLRGSKGYEKIYVDNVGKIIKVVDSKEASAGNDVYLTIDAELQKASYKIAEQKLAGLLIEKLVNNVSYVNTEDMVDTELRVSIGDVYFSLIDNNIIDYTHFDKEDAGTYEKGVDAIFKDRYASAISSIKSMLASDTITYKMLSPENVSYCDFIISHLFTDGYLSFERVNTADETYIKWKNGELTVKEYLIYAISKGWLDISNIEMDKTTYSDSYEIYEKLCDLISDSMLSTVAFKKLVYKTFIKNGQISGSSLCMILYEQGILDPSDGQYDALARGSVSAYDFAVSKIRSLELTPGMLGLDPCSAGVVITNPDNGNTLACVSYPGYDNNRLANSVDTSYYYQLTQSKSYPLFNHATQELTAPGSTFKMITSTAAVTENYITVNTIIDTKGIFEEIQPSPKCWIYPNNHGPINVVGAIQHSCNYFFYQMGYNFSLDATGNYNAEKGNAIISKYAEAFGLGEKSGLEVVENTPTIASEYPVTAAIGQSNHGFAVAQLARYVMTVANNGKCYSLTLLDRIEDKEGHVIYKQEPNLSRTVDGIADSTWDALHRGMRAVVGDVTSFNNVKTPTAGKTGTAEASKTRGNHALFVCYAPYDAPKIAIASRIPFGYGASNSAEIAAEIIKYYFKEPGYESIISGNASSTSGQVISD